MFATSVQRPAPAHSVRRGARHVVGSLGYAIALGPLTLSSLGRRDPVAFWQGVERRLLGRADADRGPTVGARRAPHGLLGLLFGVVGLVVLGLLGLFVARGALYPVFDQGPYDTSWGGPTMAGAWAVHFVVALGGAVATAAVATGVTEVHRRATRWLQGRTVPGWVAPAAAAVCVVVAMFLVAFVRQL